MIFVALYLFLEWDSIDNIVISKLYYSFMFMLTSTSITKEISYQEYIDRFLVNLPTDYHLQNTPLQVYELGSLSAYLNVPTPLLKPSYSFLVHISEGNFTQQVGAEVIHIKAPAILIVGHSYATALLKAPKNIKGYYIHIEDKALNILLSEPHLLSLFDIDPVLKLTKEQNEWFGMLNGLLYTELSGERPDRETANALSQALLHKVIVLSNKSKSLSTAQAVALKFKQLAYQYYIAHKDVGFYAKEIGISSNYLNRCVKKVFGKTIKEVILEICILQSQLLLQDMTKDIATVAYDLNFEDPSYWGRLFKKITGQTPSEYRKAFMHD